MILELLIFYLSNNNHLNLVQDYRICKNLQKIQIRQKTMKFHKFIHEKLVYRQMVKKIY